MRDVVRSYLQIASGLTEMTKQRVTEVARTLVERSGIDLEQVPEQATALPQYVQQVAEELYETGKANRDLLVGIVRGEVDKALNRTKPWTKDLIRAEEEIIRLKGRVTDLEHRLARASTPRPPRPTAVPVTAETPPRRATTRTATQVTEPPPVDGVPPHAPHKTAHPPAGAVKRTAPVKKTPSADGVPEHGPRKTARKPADGAAKKAAPSKKATKATRAKPATGPDAQA
jgi:polyhydroxyalkanoate synthesis regulator phasin